MTKNGRNVDMINGPLLKNVWLFAIPIILTGILQLLFNSADLVVVGRFAGSACVAAVGATTSLINLIVNLFIGFSVGVGVTVANALGAKKNDEVFDAIHTAIPMASVLGVALAVVGIFVSRPILEMMETPDDVIALSAVYMRIYFCGSPGSLIYNYGAAILRANGDTRRPLTFLAISGVVNVILNVIFVVVFGRNVDGVAIATIISQYLSAVLVMICLLKSKGSCRFDPRCMRISAKPLKNIVKIGLPAGLQNAFFGISNVIIQSSINAFGSVVVAGNAAASNIESFSIISMNAFNQAAMNFTGQNVGAGRLDRVPKIRRCTILSGVLLGEIMGISFYLMADTLLGFYITDSPESIAYGTLRLGIISALDGLNGLHDISTGVLRGLGASFVPMCVTVFGICIVRLIWIFTVFRIPRFHTLKMLYSTYPISWIITFLILCICFRVVYRKALTAAEKAKNDSRADN